MWEVGSIETLIWRIVGGITYIKRLIHALSRYTDRYKHDGGSEEKKSRPMFQQWKSLLTAF